MFYENYKGTSKKCYLSFKKYVLKTGTVSQFYSVCLACVGVLVQSSVILKRLILVFRTLIY